MQTMSSIYSNIVIVEQQNIRMDREQKHLT